MNAVIIFFEYIKIGIFNVGGGLATLPFIYQLAENHSWFAKTEIPDMLAVSQLIPGAIGVNLMAYSGMRAGGIIGSLLAVLGFVMPAIIIIIIIEKMYEKFKQNRIVQNVFCGLRPAAAGLLAAACCGLLSPSLISTATFSLALFYKFVNYRECAILLIFFVLMSKINKPPTLFILAGAVVGVVLKL